MKDSGDATLLARSVVSSFDIQPDLRQIRVVADFLPYLAWSCLASGHCDYLSRRWVEYTGVEEADQHGRGWLNLLHPDDRERTGAAWDAFIRGEAEYSVDYRLRRHDGEHLWFKTRGVMLLNADGVPTRVVGTTTDIDAQKRAEDKLRESQQRLAAALAASGTGTFRWDIVTNALDWDEQLDRLFGLPPGETVRSLSAFIECVHPVDRPGVIERCQRCKEEWRDFSMEFRVIWPDGSIHWLDDRGRTFRDAVGQPAYMTGACVDITQRKRAERRIQELDERASFVRKASGVGFWYCDLPFDVLEWDDLVKEHFHLPPDAYVTIQTFYERIHEHDRKPTRVAIERSIREREGYDVHYRTVHPETGAEKWIRAIGRTWCADDGQPIRFDGVTLDVTQQRRAEEKLRTSEERFRAFMDNSPAAAWVTDREGRIRYLSAAYSRLFHLPQRELIGALPSDLYPEQFARQYLSNIAKVADSRMTLQTVESAPRPDGTIGQFLVYKFPLPGSEDIGGVAFDVTDRLLAEEQLRDADRRKDEFLALLAHELRNPLAPLRSGLQVMRLAGSQTELIDQSREMMERQLGHLVRLVDDLLDISRISQNKLELRRERMLLSDVIANAVEASRPALDAAGHEFTIFLPREPVWIYADLTRLAQVFANLLINAAKYTPARGRVRLIAENSESDVTLIVEDNGIGIPAEALPTIFDMFSQVNRSLERSTGGLGIGLALVKALVEMHSGRVTANSEGPGTGSRFVVTIPKENAQPRHLTAPSALTEPPRRGPSCRILIVDDNRDAANSMALMLKVLGHDVRKAHDGLEAITEAEAYRPALILMDVGMPALNGYDATRRIRQEPWSRDMTIVALTGWGQDADRAESKSAGCDGHLVKPVELNDLLPFIAASCQVVR